MKRDTDANWEFPIAKTRTISAKYKYASIHLYIHKYIEVKEEYWIISWDIKQIPMSLYWY